ncbi:ABC transporter substrate-binding protein [Arthrobacter antibioticus]|uniref:ABC transporter substrate-binding protein n=1 Tax=Arthrobacter sp. H35-MC1 TaxID=3046203 RepID=UPI0024BBE62C|nr:extracellular solute-binding protein [Arthrobacter sp. H35-MC1]MDJ0318267.1 extracellular solute-binding protein [Arthrobacter sp. H35-MC1]
MSPSAFTRRKLLSLATVAGAALALPACSGTDGITTIRLQQNKPEVVEYFNTLIKDFESKNTDIRVIQDFNAGNWVPGLIRNNPADVVTNSYSVTVADFTSKGIFADLSDLPAATMADPKALELIKSFGQYQGSELSALPFSLAAAGVIYNKTLFAEHGVEVPATWSEFLTVCKKFKTAGITPIYGTFRDSWTLGQPYGYTAGGTVDLADFFSHMPRTAEELKTSTKLSFSTGFKSATEKFLEILEFTQKDAGSKSYTDGNAAFAKGGAAMYMQGPWALSELTTINPDLKVGTFALPTSEDPADTHAQVTLDMTFSIVRSSPRLAAAKRFVNYLMDPAVVSAYNSKFSAFSPLKQGSQDINPQIAGLQPLISSGKYYLNVTNYFPPAITLNNYFQTLALNGNDDAFLTTLDDAWHRVATRNA